MTVRTAPRLSVVVACVEADHTLQRCVDALRTTCDGIDGEILLVHDADHPLRTEGVRSPGVRVVSVRGGSLIPRLWAAGFAASRGDAVAFSTGHCIVGAGWARALLAALDAGATGAGGAIALGRDAGVVDRAVYYLRYSAFMPPAPRGQVAEIAGDNAAYDRSELERQSGSFADGFWEVEFHRRARAAGGHFVSVPEATAEIGRSFTFGTILRHRYLHGMRCGEDRARAHGLSRWRSVAAAPVVPFLLVARILRRTRRWQDRLRVISALPVLLTLATSWSIGEGRGGWSVHRSGPLTPLPKRG